MTIDTNSLLVSTSTDMKTTRKYTMGARAQAVDATRRRIVDALIALAGERPFAEVTLDTVAERAGVSVQTVLRQFGSRDGLFAEAMDAAMVDAEDERRTPPGDVAAAVRIVVDHYERRGRTALLMLAQEGYDDVARKATDRGKAMHRDWVRDAFAPVDRRRGAARPAGRGHRRLHLEAAADRPRPLPRRHRAAPARPRRRGAGRGTSKEH